MNGNWEKLLNEYQKLVTPSTRIRSLKIHSKVLNIVFSPQDIFKIIIIMIISVHNLKKKIK